MNTLASNSITEKSAVGGPHFLISEDKKQFFPIPAAQLGVLVFLATATMLFAAFTSSYLIRRSMSDWQPISAPIILYLNTVVLLLSSWSLERTRAALWSNRSIAVRKWLLLTILLGIGFLAGQIGAWLNLSAQGIFLSSNPHSSFFYILTGLHGLHLLGGLAMLFYLMVSLGRRTSEQIPPSTGQRFRAGAMYWHFLSGLWVALFVVIFFI